MIASRPMRVVHIIDEPYDSGIVQYALAAAAGLQARGHACRVWGLAGRFPLKAAQKLGLPVKGYRRPWLELPALRRSLQRHGVGLVVAHSGSAHSLAVAAAAWHRGANLAVLRTRGDARPLRRRAGSGLLWSRTTGFVAANRRILEQFGRIFPDGPPAACVYQGCPDPGRPLPPENTAPTVGIVARLDPVKGHACLLEAAARVLQAAPDARFMIAGRQENVSARSLRSMARRLGIEERVELLGHVPDIRALMRGCHIGVIASLGSEAVSRAAVEWMAAGRPLVATRVGCLPEYVLEGETGRLVRPGDPAAMAEAVSALVRDVFVRERMGRAARGRFEELFSEERFLDATEEFYERTADAVPSR